ncbi:hypothetical protein SAMN04489730_4053 [Amycolatopsis australiensis]|uniref:Uncharacterized protein n=2 Tax=Amycolatopsis australiensis TaxID=546364 RepID=A0A1K1RW76_9PSEU|nr:hypothetical protein SAMN04489730_4053 [Amycolatopsis australiensis]
MFALATGLLTALTAALATTLPKRAERRIEHRRLSREHKEKLYPEFIGCAYEIVTAALWESTSEVRRRLLDRLVGRSHQVAFFAPEATGQAVSQVVRAATELTELAAEIQAASKPGHQGAVDQRFAPRYEKAKESLRTAVAEFTETGRRDLEIAGAR